jgi:hypothetical protein
MQNLKNKGKMNNSVIYALTTASEMTNNERARRGGYRNK